MAVEVPELDEPGHVRLLGTRWFPMVLHEPAIFHVVILIAASHYAAQHPDRAYSLVLLSMRQWAIFAVSEAVRAVTGSVGDHVIAAVAKLAAYEAMYGTLTLYHTHMTGLERMLRLRGGLSAISGLDGFLARLLVWIDTNSAFLLDTHLHLEYSSFPIRQSLLFPSPARFLGSSCGIGGSGLSVSIHWKSRSKQRLVIKC